MPIWPAGIWEPGMEVLTDAGQTGVIREVRAAQAVVAVDFPGETVRLTFPYRQLVFLGRPIRNPQSEIRNPRRTPCRSSRTPRAASGTRA